MTDPSDRPGCGACRELGPLMTEPWVCPCGTAWPLPRVAPSTYARDFPAEEHA